MRNSIVCILGALCLVSCGKIRQKGEFTEKNFTQKVADTVALEGKFRAFIVPSDSSFVMVESTENYIENLAIKNDGKTLSITEKRETSPTGFYTVFLYTDKLPAKIALKDSVECNTSGMYQSGAFSLAIKDKSKFIGAADVKNFKLRMSDQSSANLRGSAEIADIALQDKTGLLAPFFISSELNINLKDEAFAELTTTKLLEGAVGPKNKFIYYGNPLRKISISPGADVTNKNIKE